MMPLEAAKQLLAVLQNRQMQGVPPPVSGFQQQNGLMSMPQSGDELIEPLKKFIELQNQYELAMQGRF